MEDFLIANGLPALFFLSFLAATVLPLGSEWLLVALVLNRLPLESVVATATVGNYLGACTTYGIGLWGATFLVRKMVGINDNDLARAQGFYRKYGSWSLLFSWVPVVGDPLCLIGGMMRMNFVLFSLLVVAGKLARYLAIGMITASVMAE